MDIDNHSRWYAHLSATYFLRLADTGLFTDFPPLNLARAASHGPIMSYKHWRICWILQLAKPNISKYIIRDFQTNQNEPSFRCHFIGFGSEFALSPSEPKIAHVRTFISQKCPKVTTTMLIEPEAGLASKPSLTWFSLNLLVTSARTFSHFKASISDRMSSEQQKRSNKKYNREHRTIWNNWTTVTNILWQGLNLALFHFVASSGHGSQRIRDCVAQLCRVNWPLFITGEALYWLFHIWAEVHDICELTRLPNATLDIKLLRKSKTNQVF